MRRVALLTVVFTFAMGGVALAATVPTHWYGDWTGSSHAPIGIEITRGKFSGKATVTGTGAKVTVSGKRISGGYRAPFR